MKATLRGALSHIQPEVFMKAIGVLAKHPKCQVSPAFQLGHVPASILSWTLL
jgi:hypothetical protein